MKLAFEYVVGFLWCICSTLVLSTNLPFVINPSEKVFYSSQLNVDEIDITGSGFKKGMTFEYANYFNSYCRVNISVESDTLIKMVRVSEKWRVGLIQISSVTFDGQKYALSPSISIADIISDIKISPSSATYHPTKSKRLLVPTTVDHYPDHFNATTMASVKLDIIAEDVYKFDSITVWRPNDRGFSFPLTLTVESWLPSDFIYPDNSLCVPVRVLSMDIGAGLIEFTDPVIIGYITKDIESVGNFVCNDSCSHAFDETCNDATKYFYHIAENPFFYTFPCDVGTDCTDCGGLETVILYQNNTPITVVAPNIVRKIYNKTPYLLVNGSGFVEDMKIELLFDGLYVERWKYPFNITFINSNQIKLIRRTNGYWPVGFMQMKSISSGTRAYYPNVKLYEIINTPTIEESNLKIHDTQDIIYIHATGFNPEPSMNKIKLKPTLDEAFYILSSREINNVVNDWGIALKLRNGWNWSGSQYLNTSEVSLTIVSIDSGAGEVPSLMGRGYDGIPQVFPMTIGTIYKDNPEFICDNSCEFSTTSVCNDKTAYVYSATADDGKVCAPGTDCNDCGGYAMIAENHFISTKVYYDFVELSRYGKPQTVYESLLNSVIVVTAQSGLGLDYHTITFNFDPIVDNKDYTMGEWIGCLTFSLKPNKKWPIGDLKIVSISTKDKILLPNDVDVLYTAATILPDPIVITSSTEYYNTKSKIVTIYGEVLSGMTEIDLSPTLSSSYKVVSSSHQSISVLLHPTASWLPLSHSHSKKEPLKVISISSAAGKVVLKSPVTVGYIVADNEAVKCEDTCKYAYDGVCDQAKNRCTSGTDCTDCSIALALLESYSPSDNNINEQINGVNVDSVDKKSYLGWYIFWIVLVILSVASVIVGLYYAYGRGTGVEASKHTIEMVKYVAVPQSDSDCTYI